MKKIIFILFITIILLTYTFQKDKIIIPEESIRFRIIANSNEPLDQDIKMKIKKDLEQILFEKTKNSKSKEETQKIILDNKVLIEETLDKYNIQYSINYGENYFPDKEYRDVIYESGNYESLVISLGEAEGDNWWCIMYPPLCLLESQEDKYEDTEYKFYIQEILNKIIK